MRCGHTKPLHTVIDQYSDRIRQSDGRNCNEIKHRAKECLTSPFSEPSTDSERLGLLAQTETKNSSSRGRMKVCCCCPSRRQRSNEYVMNWP